MARVLVQAHEREFGRAPSHLRLSVAWAHVSLESGRGTAMDCHNFGNLSVWEHEPVAHYVRLLNERRQPEKKVRFGPWRPVEVRFRAFDRPLDGAQAYWSHLQAHYARALRMFDVGRPYEAGLKLARDGYASADPEPYAKSIANLAGEFLLELHPEL
jgi:hypothetical protein